MSRFLVLYRSPQSAREQMAGATPEQAQAGMDAWMGWANRTGSALVDLGAPVAEATTVGGGDGDDVAGFSIVEADSSDAARALFDGHPHLQVGTIAIHEFLSPPGM